MGENSAKSMRGSGMEDVIFSGTSNRPSKNISEVLLLLDNQNNEGPVQFKDFTEISVRRKMKKTKDQNITLMTKKLGLEMFKLCLLTYQLELIHHRSSAKEK